METISSPVINPRGKTMAERCRSYAQLLTLQILTEKRIYSGDVADKDLAPLIRAWKELELLRRVMLGRPANIGKTIKGEPGKRKVKQVGAEIMAFTPEPASEVEKDQAAQ